VTANGEHAGAKRRAKEAMADALSIAWALKELDQTARNSKSQPERWTLEKQRKTLVGRQWRRLSA